MWLVNSNFPRASRMQRTTSHGKQFTVTREMSTAVARDQRWPEVSLESQRVFPNLLLFCFDIFRHWDSLRFSENKIHCSPRDQSLSVNYSISLVLVFQTKTSKIHIFTCSLDRTTFGVSPSRLAMFTLAPCVTSSFAIWSISLPLAVWSGVFPANVTLFTSAPRDIRYSATWYFPASTAWCKGVRPLLESYVRGRHTLVNSWSDVLMNSYGSFLIFVFLL